MKSLIESTESSLLNKDVKVSLKSMVAIFLTLFVLARCFTILNLLTLSISCLIIVTSILLCRRIYVYWVDMMIILFLLMMWFTRAERYDSFNCILVMLGWLCFNLFRTNQKYLWYTLGGIIIFSLANFAVNLIQMASPSTYFGLIDHLLQPWAVEDAHNSFNQLGYLCGLSDHYSRNAYYCIAGITVSASILFSKSKRKSKIMLVYLAAQIIMLLIIGKRGHTLFIFVSILFLYLQMGKNLNKKMTRFLYICLVMVFASAVVVEIIPNYVFSFFGARFGGSDISTGRFMLWGEAWNMFLKNPIFGNGYGIFSTLSLGGVGLNSSFAGVHNDYLQWLCENGVVGFILNTSIALSIYYLTSREFKALVSIRERKGSVPQILITWSFLFQTFVLTYSLTGLPHFDSEINSIYLIACAVPFTVYDEPECIGIKLKRIRLRW